MADDLLPDPSLVEQGLTDPKPASDAQYQEYLENKAAFEEWKANKGKKAPQSADFVEYPKYLADLDIVVNSADEEKKAKAAAKKG